MAKCPHCGGVLSDQWLIRTGASLMGANRKKKSRTPKQARKAAQIRWQNDKTKP